MFGRWRFAGVPGWADSGPPQEYTGMISCEIMQSRQTLVFDPKTSIPHQQKFNVLVLYNAFFDTESERFGYMDGHGNFMFIDL